MSEERNGIVLDDVEMVVAYTLCNMLAPEVDNEDSVGVASALVKVLPLGGPDPVRDAEDYLRNTFFAELAKVTVSDSGMLFFKEYMEDHVRTFVDWRKVTRWLIPLDDNGNVVVQKPLTAQGIYKAVDGLIPMGTCHYAVNQGLITSLDEVTWGRMRQIRAERIEKMRDGQLLAPDMEEDRGDIAFQLLRACIDPDRDATADRIINEEVREQIALFREDTWEDAVDKDSDYWEMAARNAACMIRKDLAKAEKVFREKVVTDLGNAIEGLAKWTSVASFDFDFDEIEGAFVRELDGCLSMDDTDYVKALVKALDVESIICDTLGF